MNTRFLLIPTTVLLLAACHQNPPVVELNTPKVSISDKMATANHYVAQSEETQMDGFVQRRGWKMLTLKCGSRLMEYQTGKGAAIDYEDSVHVRYTVTTLTDKILYSDHEEDFVAGRLQTIVGLDEAVMHLRRGSKAHLIIPSEAAYGVPGDGDRIPTRTVLVMDLEIL